MSGLDEKAFEAAWATVGHPRQYYVEKSEISKAIHAYLSHTAAPVTGVKVRELDWAQHPSGKPLWRAHAVNIGWYGASAIISPASWQFDGLDETFTLDVADIAAAKAAAQADYERRIMAALHPVTAPDEELVRAATDGWNACRKSIYAVCEDVDREAEETYLKASKTGSPTSTEGHLSEFQSGHVSGYRSGMARAAKSIARGFNSMEAMDDDNLRTALANRRTQS